ncbi:MAG: T9SS type A sorting domain-containing protein [Crocinitomicaceae bacterium]|nr:T9SS type A sorting domain-containing protein [Crocinitomicaceae bacterium]MDP4724628.1 T9SS type A sorting domain-containing protein [Crocinitomicaceae bacterium]MDP4739778.1 T9SS type A sorting domain-containing protein [Crocinitomicaceae bacterium]
MKLRYLIGLLCLSSLAFGQEATFYGYVSPTTAALVPAQSANPKQDVVIPNFKGRELPVQLSSNAHQPDWVWQQHGSNNNQKTTSASLLWQVQGIGNGISPPDPSGEADSTVYIQGTNAGSGGSYKIFNKTTGAAVSGTLVMASLSSPTVTGLGDPVILYYKSAKRWIITQFSTQAQKKLLVYVSQTSNPQGAYYFYQFTCPNFPDYPKWSISESSDALLASTNEGGPPRVYAMKLSALVTGATSPFIGVAIGYTLNGFGFQSITPVDLEGDFPAPAGQKPLFVRHRDDEKHSNGSPDSPTNDWIEIWEMTINWTNNTGSVAKIQDVPITEIDSDLCGLTSFSCIAQPGTTVKLDPLRECVMYKAPMRVFNDHQAMALCLATDVNGNNRAGVRWLELRRPTGSTGSWSLYQEGTYAPGTTLNRWMPAINIDKYGNIMLAYSTSGTTAPDYPSIQMTGRKACDPLGQMTLPEMVIKQGMSARTSNTRWGDYHHMCVDDFDGLTFYYTGVVMNSNNNIVTNVSAFKMNPDSLDLAILSAFTTQTGGICGASTQIAVVVENRGVNTVNSFNLSGQVGTGNPTNQSYTSTSLTGYQLIDTVYFTAAGLQPGLNTLQLQLSNINGLGNDENTCNDAYNLELTVIGSTSVAVNATITQQPSCNASNGTVQLQTTGSSGPYTYSLDNATPQSSNTFTNLGAGNYTYTVFDNQGCAVSGTFSITATTTIAANIVQTTTIACAGSQTANLVVTPSGGTAPYSYSIDNGADQASNTFNNLGAGTYTIGVIDANGCFTTLTYIVTQPSPLSVNMIPTMISCNGANDGALNCQVSGGTSPYLYAINGGAVTSSAVFSNLPAGSYTLTAIDANGCQQGFTSTITEPTAISLTASTTVSNGNDGTISLSASGGNSPYTYSMDGQTYYSGSFFASLAIGTYTCYVKDNNGCVTTIEVTVNSSSLSELSFELMTLYPNPNSGVFEVQIEGVIGATLDAKLFNSLGQQISSFTMKAVDGKAKETITLSPKIAAGSYFLGIYDEGKGAVLQFIKE